MCLSKLFGAGRSMTWRRVTGTTDTWEMARLRRPTVLYQLKEFFKLPCSIPTHNQIQSFTPAVFMSEGMMKKKKMLGGMCIHMRSVVAVVAKNSMVHICEVNHIWWNWVGYLYVRLHVFLPFLCSLDTNLCREDLKTIAKTFNSSIKPVKIPPTTSNTALC